MQVFAPTGSRTHFRDRNASLIHQEIEATILGGAADSTSTYTVPTGRRALIESVYCWFLITTALAAAQTFRAVIQAGSIGQFIVVAIMSGPGATGPDEQGQAGGQVSLGAGQIIQARTTIGAGAGIVEARLGFHGIEYDV